MYSRSLHFFVVSQLFLAVGLSELRVQAQVFNSCQRNLMWPNSNSKKLSKLGFEVKPSDDEKQLGHMRLRVYTITGFPFLLLFSKSI